MMRSQKFSGIFFKRRVENVVISYVSCTAHKQIGT